MSGFDFGGDGDGSDAADTAVSPAEPAPLPDDRDESSDSGDRALAASADADGRPSDGAPWRPPERNAPRQDDARVVDADEVDADGVDAGEVEAVLYAGEEPAASLPTASGRLVATSHRVLAYAPDADGRAPLRAVHRANVTDVSLSSAGVDWLVRPTAYALLAGVLLVGAGSAVSFSSLTMSAPPAAGATGVGGLLSTIGDVLSALSLLDDLLRVAGALSLLVGAALLGVYLLTRGREVVVSTAGEADTLRVDAGDADAAAVDRFAADAGFAADDGSGGWPPFGR